MKHGLSVRLFPAPHHQQTSTDTNRQQNTNRHQTTPTTSARLLHTRYQSRSAGLLAVIRISGWRRQLLDAAVQMIGTVECQLAARFIMALFQT